MGARFGRIVHINGEDGRVHLQWFDHAPNTFLDDIADSRELFLTLLCDTLPLTALCGTVAVSDFSARESVPDGHDGYFFRFMYDKADASFTEPLPAPPPTDPPYNCTVCAHREEKEIQAHGRIVRRAGGVAGVSVHGTTFHIGDFALVRAEAGPSRVAQLVGVFTNDPVWVRLQLLGRVSDLADLLPPDELRDEVRFYPFAPFFAKCLVCAHACSAICSSRTSSRRRRSSICSRSAMSCTATSSSIWTSGRRSAPRTSTTSIASRCSSPHRGPSAYRSQRTPASDARRVRMRCRSASRRPSRLRRRRRRASYVC
jgi:hypothetical protein